MELFKQVFPADCDVVVRKSEDGLLVVVRTQRPDPVWLRGLGESGGAVPASEGGWCKVSDDELRGWLLGAVKADPGRGASHYARLKKGEGGLGASQERKENMLKVLLKSGELRLFELPFKTGRLTHVVYPAGRGLASKEE